MKYIIVCTIVVCLLLAGNSILKSGKETLEKAQAKQTELLQF